MIKDLLKRFRPLRQSYYRIPFDLNAPLPEGSLNSFAKVAQKLNAEKIPYSLGFGTLLGFVREAGPIKHDTDYDLDIFNYQDTHKVREIMSGLGYTLGYEVYTRKTYFHSRKCQQLAFYNDEKIVIDFVFWYSDQVSSNGKLINFCDEKAVIFLEPSYLSRYKDLEIQAIKYQVPFEEVDYLNAIYGIDWRTPKMKTADWKDGVLNLL